MIPAVVKVVANEIVDLQLKRLRARNRWYVSAGLTWATLLLIAIAAGWSLRAVIFTALLGVAYAGALLDHCSRIRNLRRQLRKA